MDIKETMNHIPTKLIRQYPVSIRFPIALCISISNDFFNFTFLSENTNPLGQTVRDEYSCSSYALV